MGHNVRVIVSFIFITITGLTSYVHAATTIEAQVIRNQIGTGETFISSGFPFPEGLVTESIITAGTIKVVVNNVEVKANVSALRGRHSDGTLRSALIQFTLPSMTQNEVISSNTSVIIDGGARTATDPAYVRPTITIVQNNNVILPTSPTYLVSTGVTFQKLLPAAPEYLGQTGKLATTPSIGGTIAEENQFTAIADNRFDALVAAPNFGTASYETQRAMLSLWIKTGIAKYFNHAIKTVVEDATHGLRFSTPSTTASPDCKADEYVNPDGRLPADSATCALPSEWYEPRLYSYASLYLLTGYRDFWSTVAYQAQEQQKGITTQEQANTLTILKDAYDTPRYNYAKRYGALLPALMIDATIPISGQYYTGQVFNWEERLGWAVNAVKDSEWDLQWIPFESGSGLIPVDNSVISQGGVSAIFKGVYAEGRFDPKLGAGAAMPVTGYIQVKTVTGGSFSTGALTGISASATGPNESDYRQGYIGCRSDSRRAVNMTPYTVIPVFQSVFPLHFLIDYYLNVEADPRIPVMVKTNLDIILKQIRLMASGDTYYGASGGAWGNPLYGKPYSLRNPVSTGNAEPFELPEYARIIAFVLKTSGEATVNGATYSTWYDRCLDTANNTPVGVLTWQWKLFGQFYGFGSDAPWMMAQTSLTGETSFRTPTNYVDIPRDSPDLQRGSSSGTKHLRLSTGCLRRTDGSCWSW